MKDTPEYKIAKLYQSMKGTEAAALWLQSLGFPFFMAYHYLVRN